MTFSSPSLFLSRLQAYEVPLVSCIGLGDQPLVELCLAAARLVAGDEQDRTTLGVERKSHTPLHIRSFESKLLHVRVP
jgi:hypothetical protein